MYTQLRVCSGILLLQLTLALEVRQRSLLDPSAVGEHAYGTKTTLANRQVLAQMLPETCIQAAVLVQSAV
jgi:hypothetical protein